MPAPASLFIACDFDGTITLHDTLNLIVQRYAAEMWPGIQAKLLAGEISLREAIEEEFLHVSASEEDVLAYVSEEAGIREGFREFVTWCESRGHKLVVVSGGFRVVIDHVLVKAGLGHLAVHAGDATFTPRGTYLRFPPSDRECVSLCGVCKIEAIAAHGPFQGPLVYIGDGFSDRCAARRADIVFARRGLAEFLDAETIPYYAFEDFFDVMAVLDEIYALPVAESTGGEAGS